MHVARKRIIPYVLKRHRRHKTCIHTPNIDFSARSAISTDNLLSRHTPSLKWMNDVLLQPQYDAVRLSHFPTSSRGTSLSVSISAFGTATVSSFFRSSMGLDLDTASFVPLTRMISLCWTGVIMLLTPFLIFLTLFARSPFFNVRIKA